MHRNGSDPIFWSAPVQRTVSLNCARPQLLRRYGLRLQPTGADNFHVEQYAGLIVNRSFGRWPQRNMQGNVCIPCQRLGKFLNILFLIYPEMITLFVGDTEIILQSAVCTLPHTLLHPHQRFEFNGFGGEHDGQRQIAGLFDQAPVIGRVIGGNFIRGRRS